MNVVDSLMKFFGVGGVGFDGPSAPRFDRLAIASAVPILTSALVHALWYSARTVVNVMDPEHRLWVQLWLSHQNKALGRVRQFDLISPSTASSPDDGGWHRGRRADIVTDRNGPPLLTLLPAGGVSVWLWYSTWPVTISANRNSQRHDNCSEFTITIWFAPFGAAVAKDLILQGRKLWLAKRSEKTEIWTQIPHHSPTEFSIATRKSRPLSSVIVENGIKEALLEDATQFLDGEQWYVKKGIPFRRGYLLYGPPGCGKTSLVTALAGELRVPIVLVSLSSKDCGDRDLASALERAPRFSIVLIEDIDCAFIPDEKMSPHDAAFMRHTSVTLSGLLNAIDGVAAQDGRILFMTTNHKDRLNEALIRPGRVDVQYELRRASKAGARNLFAQFFPSSSDDELGRARLEQSCIDFVAQVDDDVHSFATLQGVLMQCRDEPGAAADAMGRYAKQEDR